MSRHTGAQGEEHHDRQGHRDREQFPIRAGPGRRFEGPRAGDYFPRPSSTSSPTSKTTPRVATTTSRAGNEASTALPIRQSHPSGRDNRLDPMAPASQHALPLLEAVETLVDPGQLGLAGVPTRSCRRSPDSARPRSRCARRAGTPLARGESGIVQGGPHHDGDGEYHRAGPVEERPGPIDRPGRTPPGAMATCRPAAP